ESAVAHIADNTDYLAIRFVLELPHDAAAYREARIQRIVAFHPILSRHRFIDDHNRRCRTIVTIGEGAAALDGNLENVEIPGRDRDPSAASMKRTFRRRPADDPEGEAITALQRNATCRACAEDPGQRAQAIHAVANDSIHARRLLEFGTGQR